MAGMQQALEKVWQDASYKKRVMSDPKSVLKELGVTVPDNVTLTVHENSSNTWNFPLPLKDSLGGKDPETMSPVIGKVVKRAWTDSAYKAKLLATPTAAIQEVGGVKIPAGVTIKIHEDTATSKHLVIPQSPDSSANAELSDAELARVAGGKATVGDGYGTGGSPTAADCTGGEADYAALASGALFGYSWGWIVND
jgi:hypothetical protein